MVIYNTIMGVSAGLALILVPLLARALYLRKQVSAEGWALTFGILGVILTFLGGAMAVTWPLTVNPPINIIFSEPNLALGLLLLAAAFFLWRHPARIAEIASSSKKTADEALAYLTRVLMPVSWFVAAIGLVLIACALAIARFNLVGSAPAAEPITGLLHDYPVIENTFFAILYGLSGIGTLLAPFVVRRPASKVTIVAGVCLITAGVLFLLFSTMNYYTHIGLLLNLQRGEMVPF